MEIIRLEEAKKYCDKHNVERNAWVAGAIDKLLVGTDLIQYRNKDMYLVAVDLEYIHSHMQSMEGFDLALHKFMSSGQGIMLRDIERKQAMLTIGELADDFEIGIA